MIEYAAGNLYTTIEDFAALLDVMLAYGVRKLWDNNSYGKILLRCHGKVCTEYYDDDYYDVLWEIGDV